MSNACPHATSLAQIDHQRHVADSGHVVTRRRAARAAGGTSARPLALGGPADARAQTLSGRRSARLARHAAVGLHGAVFLGVRVSSSRPSRQGRSLRRRRMRWLRQPRLSLDAASTRPDYGTCRGRWEQRGYRPRLIGEGGRLVCLWLSFAGSWCNHYESGLMGGPPGHGRRCGCASSGGPVTAGGRTGV